MKTAVNAPFDAMSLNVGSFTYGLAHLAVENKEYLEYLKSSHLYTILDNGADEIGAGLTGDILWGLVEEIQPSELILPDVLKEKDKTIQASTSFYEGYIKGTEFEKSGSLMAVAQGKTFEEFNECYMTWLETDYVDVIGIPYDIDFDVPAGYYPHDATKTEKRALGRKFLVGCLPKKKPLHLLGMNDLQELIDIQIGEGSGWIRSNDTTAPFAAAVNGLNWLDSGARFEKNWPALDFNKEWDSELFNLSFSNLLMYAKSTGDPSLLFNLGILWGEGFGK